MINKTDLDRAFRHGVGRRPKQSEIDKYAGKVSHSFILKLVDAGPGREKLKTEIEVGRKAIAGKWQERLENCGDPTSNDPEVRQTLKDKIINLVKGA